MKKIQNRIKFYLETTTLHGLRYIGNGSRYPAIRFLWLIVFISSSFFMIVIFNDSYENYKYNSISFVTETTYLEWNTTFPAVSICEVSSSETFWTPEPGEDYSIVQQFINDIIFFTGSCYSCSTPCEVCEKLNFREIAKKYRKDCRSIMKKCKWNEMSFDCCDKFLPLHTEYGICYSINSLHTTKTAASDINMKSNRKTGPGQLFIEMVDDVRLYFHAPEDVPFINSNSDQRKDVNIGERYNITINVIEISNDEGLKDISVDKRECRFPWETTKDMQVHKLYSYSTCIVQCHADAHYNLCNCTHHLMPVLSEKSFCNIEGLLCLTDKFEILNRLHAKGFLKPGLVCDCVPSCVEPEYNVVAEERGMKEGNSEILIKMQSLPTFRFKRNVVRSTMDLVVSIGGAAGLFIGASLLSIIETPYLLLLRR